MIIGGLQKFSLLDYPGHLAAVIFTKGCNFRCQFCYNPMLVWPSEVGKFANIASSEEGEVIEKGHPAIDEDDLFLFLKSRAGKLDAVVITGGEPTIQPDLPGFIAKIKNLGFKVKLDTNGTNSVFIKNLFLKNLVDYLAMDIKSPAKKYDIVTGVQPDLLQIKNSIKIIKDSGVPYEFRSTIVPELITAEDIEGMGEMIAGADLWFLQQFKSDTELVNSSFQGFSPYDSKTMEKMKEAAERYVKKCELR